MSTGRRRLSPEDRRVAILAAAAELFAVETYEAVSVDDVAVRAGCSRALLDHYFPSKHTLFMGMVNEGTRSILARTSPSDQLTGVHALRVSVHNYFSWASENSALYRSMYRAASLDPEVAAALAAGRARQAARILEGLPKAGFSRKVAKSRLTRLLVRSWATFVTSLCLDWLDNDEGITVDELTNISVTALGTFLQSSMSTAR